MQKNNYVLVYTKKYFFQQVYYEPWDTPSNYVFEIALCHTDPTGLWQVSLLAITEVWMTAVLARRNPGNWKQRSDSPGHKES